jgi:hypothetical protein
MTKMLAMAVPEPGGSFRREERDLPEPGHHEVRVRVQACGVCHSVCFGAPLGPPIGLEKSPHQIDDLVRFIKALRDIGRGHNSKPIAFRNGPVKRSLFPWDGPLIRRGPTYAPIHTLEEYKCLLAAAGLQFARATATATSLFLIEAVAA